MLSDYISPEEIERLNHRAARRRQIRPAWPPSRKFAELSKLEFRQQYSSKAREKQKTVL